MEIFQAIILGVVQGFTEFLPISSSGHLILIPYLFDWTQQPLEFDAVIHLATLIAILIFFRQEVARLIYSLFSKDPVKKDDRRLGWIILIATIPAIILGLLLHVLAVNPFRNTVIVVINLIGWALVMFIIDRLMRIPVVVDRLSRINWRSGIFVGIAQAIALIPGTSRSGITITAGLAEGFSRATAARFAFLLGIPAIAAAGSASMFELAMDGFTRVQILPLVIAFLAALVSGYLAIRVLIKFLERYGLTIFVVYRLILGLILIIFLLK
jgi:undecaprenyl-diphosphatase